MLPEERGIVEGKWFSPPRQSPPCKTPSCASTLRAQGNANPVMQAHFCMILGLQQDQHVQNCHEHKKFLLPLHLILIIYINITATGCYGQCKCMLVLTENPCKLCFLVSVISLYFNYSILVACEYYRISSLFISFLSHLALSDMVPCYLKRSNNFELRTTHPYVCIYV
jgi:hypothetical protein